ncbi:MAG: TraR/DksA family transcriptional regulator [Ectothiorhodospiraceae bacterium]|nr:TraR/DksA family transcriptional regulator [Ectothiorhodospiraceae bacterium]
MASRDYDDIRLELETRRDELARRIARVEHNVRHAEEPLSSDFAEQAIQRQNEEVVDALGNEAKRELASINRALRRIEEGTYGECVVCGAAIPPARLRAIPYTDRCTACAEKAETTGVAG